MKAIIKKYFLLIPFCALYALGIACFLDPNNLTPGGVTGIAILLNRLLLLDTGTLLFLLNIPLLLVCVWRFGIRFTFATLYSLLWISLFTNIFEKIGVVTEDLFLASITGGAICAVALGMILRLGATTGGMDIVIKMLREKYPHLKTGFLFFAIDSVILSFSLLVFGTIDSMLYAAVSIFVTSKVLDMVLYGNDEARMIFVVSNESEKIAEIFLREMKIGATYLYGKGAYLGNEKRILLCVMKKRMAPKAIQIVEEADKSAFLIISNASEIYGEGYKNYGSRNVM